MKNILLGFCLFTFPALASSQTEFLKPEGLASSTAYTHVVVAKGKMIFIAGQVANDKDGKLVGKDDLKTQATQIFENIKTALAAAGATTNDLVKINWYVKGYKPEMLATLREVRSEYVSKTSPPASTLVGVASLFQEDYLLEIDAVAVIGDAALPKPDKKK
jgi:enamine deaminase RidA (YjgF/YER057c/UK114 family)